MPNNITIKGLRDVSTLLLLQPSQLSFKGDNDNGVIGSLSLRLAAGTSGQDLPHCSTLNDSTTIMRNKR